MTARSSRAWTPASAAGVSMLFLIAFFCGGVWVGAIGVDFLMFDLVDGLAALLILFVLLNTGVLSWPGDVWGGVVLVYAAAATAQLVSLLLPPPGVLEWVVLGVLLYFAWNASFGAHRTRVILALGLVALGLAALKYSVLPFIWARTELPRTPILDLRALGEGMKALVALYVPTHAVNQVYAFAALLAWVLAVWLQWPPEKETDWLRQLPRSERDRLLFWLLGSSQERGRALGRDEVRGYLDRQESDG